MGKIIGIDLGTTKLGHAVWKAASRPSSPNAEGGRTTPSVVAFTKPASNWSVLSPSARRSPTRKHHLLYQRFLGRKFSEREPKR